MAKNQHCGDRQPHPPHDYYEPSTDPNDSKQVKCRCPGTK